jgi:hypothetical protein
MAKRKLELKPAVNPKSTGKPKLKKDRLPPRARETPLPPQSLPAEPRKSGNGAGAFRIASRAEHAAGEGADQTAARNPVARGIKSSVARVTQTHATSVDPGPTAAASASCQHRSSRSLSPIC